MANTWAATGANEWTEKQAVVDAISNGDLQAAGSGPPAAWSGSDSDQWPPWSQLALYVTLGTGHPTGTVWPTKTEVETYRAWDPTSDIPTSFTASDGDPSSPSGKIDLAWTDDSGISQTWAQSDIEVVIYQCTGASCTPTTEVTTVDYGVEGVTIGGLTIGQDYGFRIRYRSKSDGSLVGSYTTTQYATAQGTPPA